MSYHIFQKETVNLCFSHTKKINQNHKEGERMSRALHNFHDSKSFALLDTNPTFTAFQDEGCMPLHSKTHVHIRL